jgi:hypothetical protein
MEGQVYIVQRPEMVSCTTVIQITSFFCPLRVDARCCMGPRGPWAGVTPGPLTLKGASRKWPGIAPSASIIVLPSEERVERRDEGRQMSGMMVAEPGSEAE